MRLSAYERHFWTGDWQCHTTWSDGENTPDEMVEAAIRLGLTSLAITDHVRLDTEWFDDYGKELRLLKRRCEGKILLLVGFEAKAVDLHGGLDARPEWFDVADVALGSIHRIPLEDGGFLPKEEIARKPDLALKSWTRTMLALVAKSRADVVAHPESLLAEHGIRLPVDTPEELGRVAARSGKIFEQNLSYGVPLPEFRATLERHKVPMLLGSDAHSIAELERLHRSRT
ncbi:MAG: PHP domain-containing protein [Methanobacteriota archaeon]